VLLLFCHFPPKYMTFIPLILVWILIDWDPISWYNQMQRNIYLSKCGINEKAEHLFSSIVKSDCDGRLGNQLSNYATLWHFKETYGLQPILNNFQQDILAEVFEPENFMIKPCDLNLAQLQGSSNEDWEIYMTTGIMSMPNYDYTTFFANAHRFLENKFLDIGGYPNALDLYKDDLVELQRHLKFKEKYIGAARTALLAALASMDPNGKYTFVGLHARRTDKLVQSSSYGNIDGEYYRSAIRSFRNDFGSQRVIFIAATDNVQWLKRELLLDDQNFVADNVFFSVDLFQYSGIRSHEKGYDLALLSLCNHSIISASTFGQWGALLAGGQVIYPTGFFPSPILSHEERIIDAAKMDNWHPLNVSSLRRRNKNQRSRVHHYSRDK